MPATPAPLGLTRNAWVIIGSWILFSFGFALFMPYLPNYIKLITGTELAIGLLMSVSEALSITQLVGGYLGDAYGRRRIVVPMTWVIALSYLLLAFATSWEVLLVFFIINGACRLYAPALRAMFADSLPVERRTRGFVLANTLPAIAALPAPLIGGLLLSRWRGLPGYRRLILLGALFGLASAALRQLFLEETLTHETWTGADRRVLAGILRALRRAGRRAGVVIILSTIGVTLASMAQGYYVRYAMLSGLDEAQWGALVVFARALVIAVSLLLLPSIERLRPSILFAASLVIHGVGSLEFSAGSMVAMGVGLSLCRLGSTLLNVASESMLTELVPPAIRGRVWACWMVTSGLAGTAGNLLGALIYTRNPAALFELMGASLLTLAPVALALLEACQRQADSSSRDGRC